MLWGIWHLKSSTTACPNALDAHTMDDIEKSQKRVLGAKRFIEGRIIIPSIFQPFCTEESTLSWKKPAGSSRRHPKTTRRQTSNS